MKLGKGMDINHHISEQYRDGGLALHTAIANFWNQCYIKKSIPFPVKQSLVFFSLKPRKCQDDPNNYRTISQVTKMYEIGEILMWKRTKNVYQKNLNKGHIGFIPGSGSTNGQLLVQ